MMRESAACGDEHGAALQAKMELFRESTGPSVLERRLKMKVIEEPEGTSTTDTTDTGSESSDVALDLDDMGERDDECDVLFRSPDPFDYMPSVRVRPAFCEKQVAEVWPLECQNATYSVPAPVMQPMAPPEQPMQMPMMQMPPMPSQMMQMPPMQPMVQQMAMPPMQQMGMQPMQQMAPQCMASCASNPSPSGKIMVPVPVPVPMNMPFAMPAFSPQSVPVPAGFKLVRIPDATEERTEPAPMAKSAISNPASTERKIFVGGLNPSTTGQTLREYFSTFGPVTDAKVIRDGEKSKGFGFVQFKECIPADVLDQAHIIDQRRCGVGPAFHARVSAQEEVA
jgi:hypothetical protein